MAWEILKNESRRHRRFDKPAVTINKAGFTLNGPLWKEYANGSRSVLIHADREANKLGLKFVPNGEYEHYALRCQPIKGKGREGTGSHKVAFLGNESRFPEQLGGMYRAHASDDSRIIVVDLSPGNRID